MEIVLYDCRWQKSKKTRFSARKALRQTGFGLLFLAFFGIIFAFSPAVISEIAVGLKPKMEATPVQTTFQNIIKEQESLSRQLASKEAEKYKVDIDFSLVIPKISAAAKIIPNVNPGNENEYLLALKSGVAHASGSGFPGSQSTIFLFAHSTNSLANISRYNAIFYQLKDLTIGDKIIVFYAGRRFVYQVTDNLKIDAGDTSWLSHAGEEKLVLQTCWPPGTTLKRLIVVAKPV